jgi:hypothetical protein
MVGAFTAITAASLAFGACSGSPEPETPEAVAVDLRGQVVDADTGQPIAGVAVATNGQRFTTGPDGSYSFQGLTAGARRETLREQT